VGVSVFVAVCLLIDCNNFFYKFLVWLPPDHALLKFRVVLIGFTSLATSKEWYEYVSNPHCHRLGPFAWMTFYVSLIELSSVLKFQTTEFQAPFPLWIKCGWAGILCVYLLGLSVAFKNGRKMRQAAFDPYNPLLEIKKHE
jgi:phosphatidylserine synthase 2